MPSSRYYRIKTLTREEKIRRWKTSAFWFFWNAGFLAIIWSFFFSPFFKITEINLPANDLVSKDDIRELIDNILPFKTGENLFLLPKNHLQSDITEAFPSITNLKINKELFHSLFISFEKRIPIGMWCPEITPSAQTNCYYFDKEGIIFNETPKTEGSLILKILENSQNNVSLGTKIIDDGKLNFIQSFDTELSKAGQLRITEYKINPQPDLEFEAITNEGWAIYLETSQDPVLAVKNLLTVLKEALKNNSQNLDYVDLRIPSRIFYKTK